MSSLECCCFETSFPPDAPNHIRLGDAETSFPVFVHANQALMADSSKSSYIAGAFERLELFASKDVCSQYYSLAIFRHADKLATPLTELAISNDTALLKFRLGTNNIRARIEFAAIVMCTQKARH